MNGMKLSDENSDSEISISPERADVLRQAMPCKQIWLALIVAKPARFGAGERI